MLNQTQEEIKELESQILKVNIGSDPDNISLIKILPDEILGTFVFKHLPLI